ncbi:MAG: nicotinate-nucleotide adenylyltransferase [Chloroflexi bacterium]|nr:nicotinate-nucleotide adenylyltransferase [Chloroflexota bacterium]MCI0576330.1 nicotinate-nucleotide adenylyltransferase [Chloroflexota bacterium]MCI0650129.1 nicotinate-nucleotide adenylyltransferase [Chloroflexota bacterium]MCI0731213.1 nicotinate-nucleotide adenylyltransferase [Chloroflexota bacterium]
MERIGLLGGTFDPPHIGHLWLAEAARQQLNLDRVLFMPAGRPPHKADDPVTAAHHRLAMTALAIQGNLHLALDESDIRRPLPHYTVTLLPLVRQAHPDAALWLLLGSDSLHDLPTWRQPRQVISQCRLGVLPRPGVVVDWVSLTLAVPGVDAVVDPLAGPSLDVSATAIRRWVASGHSPRYLVPAAVLEYITQQRLYQP